MLVDTQDKWKWDAVYCVWLNQNRKYDIALIIFWCRQCIWASNLEVVCMHAFTQSSLSLHDFLDDILWYNFVSYWIKMCVFM